MPGEFSSDRPPDRLRKAKTNLRVISLGLEKRLKVTRDSARQRQGPTEKDFTRTRQSDDVLDKGRAGCLGRTEVALSGNLGKRARLGGARRGAGGPAEVREETKRGLSTGPSIRM